MTYDDVITMLEEAGLPLAYDHFAEGESPDPPFLVFLYPGSDNMFADDTVFKKIDELNIELGRLQLEQATWAESNRVDQVARTRLEMLFPRTEDIVVLRP